jgi:hypothetical protein
MPPLKNRDREERHCPKPNLHGTRLPWLHAGCSMFSEG